MSKPTALFTSIVLCCASITVAGAIDTNRPVVMVPSDSTPVPGEVVTVTVSFSSVATQSGYVTISSSTASGYSFFPKSIPVNPGDTSETFEVIVSPSAQGTLNLAASAGSATASTQLLVSSTVQF